MPAWSGCWCFSPSGGSPARRARRRLLPPPARRSTPPPPAAPDARARAAAGAPRPAPAQARPQRARAGSREARLPRRARTRSTPRPRGKTPRRGAACKQAQHDPGHAGRLERQVGYPAEEPCSNADQRELAQGGERLEHEIAGQVKRGGETSGRREARQAQRHADRGHQQADSERRNAGLHRRMREPALHQPRPTRITPFSERTTAKARLSCPRFATSKVKRMKASSSRLCVRTAVTLILSRARASPMSLNRPRRSAAVTVMSTV